MNPHPSSTMSAASKLAMHKDSHVVSKFKPKISIIHILAPEIIKTDVENFRELVQQLTGKPTDRKGKNETTSAESESCMHISHNGGDRMKKESEQICGSENSIGFIGGFGEMDDLVQDLTQIPLLPLKSSQFNIYGGMPLFQ
ncbi:VQ motif-containing protein 25-like [Camellia sinensis]|uniref:VQ domain-containing protein n=1 Tax=Camellia sinensis var. sinensis TaxID=542762 RepID=A0A4V3WQ59_CAMSN|nr:VQ motif-containing protein 25-like [Camellia sinensis]THG18977.1 hypothetical protein TEA_005120 [Camellia sinensis var. sinensis]